MRDIPKQRAAQRAYVERNKEACLARSRAWKARQTDWINKLKSEPCVDCGLSFFPAVMEFDHLSDKHKNISVLIHSVSKEQVLEEIAKCELVCSNCHRVRTWLRTRNLPLDTDPWSLLQ